MAPEQMMMRVVHNHPGVAIALQYSRVEAGRQPRKQQPHLWMQKARLSLTRIDTTITSSLASTLEEKNSFDKTYMDTIPHRMFDNRPLLNSGSKVWKKLPRFTQTKAYINISKHFQNGASQTFNYTMLLHYFF